MKRRNGFFSFSIVTVAVLTLSLALTAATLAWQHFQMARTYEETVRLTYLAESALCEGWNQLRQARAAAPGTGVQQTCGLHFAVTADEQGRTVLHFVQYVN